MANEREMTIPKENADPKTEDVKEPLTQQESELIEKVFFEDDEEVRLRDGRTYRIPPLGLRDARLLMKKLNTIDTSIIISNLIDTDGEDRFDELMEVLYMAFKPYHRNVTIDYLSEMIDLVSAKSIIDSMIGLNGLKKSLA